MAASISVSFRVPPLLVPRLVTQLSPPGEETSSTRRIRIRWGEQELQVEPNGAVHFRGDEEGLQRLRQELERVFAGFAVAIGTDEVGLSSPIGPIVVAGVLLNADSIPNLLCGGVRDSKRLVDANVGRLRDEILSVALANHVRIFEPSELNTEKVDQSAASRAKLLAEAHSVTVTKLLEKVSKPQIPTVRLGLSKRSVYSEFINNAPWRKSVRLEWAPKAEMWPEVAAASIIARATWLSWVQEKSEENGRDLRAMSIEEMAAHPDRTSLFKIHVVEGTVKGPPSAGVFTIRPYSLADKAQLRTGLLSLRPFYPTIDEWIEPGSGKKGIFDKMESGSAWCWVAAAGPELAAFVIVSPRGPLRSKRGPRVAKVSTFYVYPKFRGRAIGSQLMNRVINLTVDRGVERLYVTLASEERSFFVPFLRDFGFLVDGINPQRYRRSSYEIIMGRTAFPYVVAKTSFGEFVRRYLFELRGFDTNPVGQNRFLAHSRLQLPGLFGVQAPERYLVEPYLDPELKPGTAWILADDASKETAHGVLVCLHGLSRKPYQKNLTVLDAYDIETMFYPVQLERAPDVAWTIPIRPDFANQLIPRWTQATLEPIKLQLSTKNVYYRVADRVEMLRRGATIFWYVSDEGEVRGESKLAGWQVGSPRDLSRRFGPIGAWAEKNIEQHVGPGNQALAIEFDWYREYAKPVTLTSLRDLLPKFNPQTIFPINEAIAREIRRLGTLQEMQYYSQ